MRQIALAMAVSCLLSVVACGQATQPVDELEQLKQIRQDLRAELRQRAASDAEIEPPRDVLLEIDDGVGRGRMRVLLRRQGGRWFVRNIDAGSRGPADLQADPSGLSWEDGHIAGPLLLSWQKTTDSGETVRRSQRFNLELQIEQIPRRLVLTFHRFQGGSDWVLAYEPEAEQYVLAEELEIPRQLTGEDPMDREFGTFEPNEKGHFEGRVSMTYAGSHQRLSRSYDGHQPRVTFQGRLIGGRVHGDWTLRAPSGKGLLGTGQDRLSGAIETGRLRGTYRSTGDKGTWKGAVSGARMPVAENPVAWLADEPAPDAPTDLADATARAAELYREIRALDKALRQYPMPVTDALSRTLVPKPAWPEDAEPQAMQTYVDGLVKQARLAAEQKPVDIPTGPLSPDAPAFGPFYGQADLADPNTANHLPAVGDGPQQWRSVMDWQMVGPFPVYDQQASLCHPEVLAAGQPAFHRTRLFTRPDGTVNDVEDTVGWMAARMDGATVAAPARPEASAGAMRYLAWYATTDIQSETEQTVWLAVELQGQGMIWLNDQLVWDSGVDWDSTRPAVFQVHLRKGTNRLLVRCASNPPSNKHCATVDYLNGHTPRPAGRIDFTTFALHVCSQGGPGNAMDQSKVIAAEPNAPRSYRNGGQGIYPDADPPLAWNAETGTNVAWSMDMPYGTGQPVVRDGRLYLTAEPASLICLDVASGETLWRHDLLPVPAPPAEGEEVDRTASATAAPVVTADRVYAQFGHGEVVCYDRNGEEIWRVSATEPWEHPNMGSPVLVEGNLIIQTLSRGGRNMAAFNVMALDAETGETRWTATGSPKRTTTKWDWSAGFGNGLAVMELANGDQQRTLVITGDGGVLDAATGEMLHRDIFALEATRAGPYVDGDTVYIAPVTGEQAVKLWLDPQGRVGARTLWKNPPRWGLGQVKTVRGWGARHWMKGPVVHDGLMYVVRVDSAHVPGHYVCSWTQLEALDVQDGSVVARMRANLRDATDPTIPPAIAGAYVYIGDGGAPVAGFGGETEFGKVAVLELLDVRGGQRDKLTMRTPIHQGVWGLAALVSRNKTGRTRCAPVFEGDRMLLRSFNQVTCVRSATEAGRRYEMEQLAANTMNELIGRKPEPPTVRDPNGSDEPPTGDVPVLRVGPGAKADDWLVLGPLDVDAERDVLSPLGGPAELRAEQGDTLTIGGEELTFRRVKPAHFIDPGQVDVAAALGGNRDCQAYLYGVLSCERAQKLRYSPSAIVAGTWLGGVKLQRDDLVHLDLGYYPMLIQVRLSQVPSFAPTKVGLGFKRPPQQFDSPAFWTARVQLLQDRLRNICTELPGTGLARTARLSLKQAQLPVPPAPERAGRPRPEAPTASNAESDQTSAGPARPAKAADSYVQTGMIVGGVALAIVFLGLLLLRRRSDTAE